MEQRNAEVSLSPNRQDQKWAQHVCYALIVILNLSTWIDLNSVWIELPLIYNSTPEGWTLPSILSLIINLANIFPIIVVLIRLRLRERFSEIPYIYTIIIVGVVACLAIGLFWKETLYIFGAQRSYALITAVFALGILDCTSSLVFCDYMRHYKVKYLHAMFLGESFTATIPTLLAVVQGIGGEAKCIQYNSTSPFEPVYSEPRFSVSVFFFLIMGIIIISLVAFVILRTSPIVGLAGAEERINKEECIETCEMLLKFGEDTPAIRKLSITIPKSMTRKEFVIIQWFNVINSGILYGCLPTITTYSMLPYGQRAFYYCSILYPLAYPLAAMLAWFRQTISIFWVSAGSIIGCFICGFIIFIACQSPCPIWADTTHGGVIMVLAWFSSTFILAYVRIASGNNIKLYWKKESGLFYFGFTVQTGIIFGVLPFFLIINVFNLLKDRKPCITYCI
ncbi:unnamed protein product [Adineta ricciae]|uniref:Riboflavin transporter n=1 Tax=Adineta ricciae TaxID=249248 RepID=A0A815A9F2_ADIRI|nr:unnamed protein product [Adineta ricciae]CAF1252528.1 unnamed protein product [Adineta ricciae]